MDLQEKILSYLEAAGKQNDDVLEFHQQDAMTLAINLTNAINAPKEK